MPATPAPRSAPPDPNGPRVPLPAARTTLDLIEEQIRLQPDRPAVVHGRRVLSYRDLDAAANALAHRLPRHGADRSTLLPVFVDDGLELPIALVAAMKAATPFVPFDPSWPEDRISTLVGDIGTGVALVSPRSRVQAPPTLRLLNVDHTDLLADTAAAQAGPGPRPDREDLAYGFFTSGTTGLPKCTLNVHRGLLNRLSYMTRRFGAGHISLQNSRSTFDSSLWQLLWPLTMGGTVVMPRRDGLLDLESTVRQIGRHGVTVTDFVPSIFAVLVDMLGADPDLLRQAESLRHLLIGGEAINAQAVRRFHDLLPRVRITNTYGPTEAAIGSVFHTIESWSQGEIPLGRPIDNTAAVVVGENLERVGSGVTGEILIGGDCLGLGYLGDPERTRAVFVPNPFPDISGDRLYRTGDLGQYRADGLLYFAGRRDDQIKVRGVRIEPSEVERHLGRLPGVSAVHVVALAREGGPVLVAAVTAQPGFDPVAARAAARGLLPAEMVPDRFVALPDMPLSANGKVDRAALRRLLDEAGSAPPAGEARELRGREREIQRLWSELIGDAPTGPDQSFLDAGGTSLSLHQLSLRIQRRYGVRLPVRAIALAPTIRAQALLVDAALAGAPPGEVHAGSAGAADAVVRAMIEDARLPESFAPRGTAAVPAGPPRRILLTGAAGFVGIHLLDELLRSTDAAVVCLVRAADEQAARARMEQRARYYGIDLPIGHGRIEIVHGDLTAERFALDPVRYERLADTVDCVVHAAAEVNLLHDYARLRAANVGGTLEILRFAAAGGDKTLHHISTLGLLPSDGTSLGEHDFPEARAVPARGYDQTKWVAEALVRQAAGRGLRTNVYRLGDVMPHSLHGVFSHGGSLAEFIVGACVELAVRVETGASSDFTPVDAVCRFIAAAVAQGDAGGGFHVGQPQPVRLDDLLACFGEVFELKPVAYADFAAMLAERAERDAGGASIRLAAMLASSEAGMGADAGSLARWFESNADPAFWARCLELSERLRVPWLPVDTEVFHNYARSFRGGGRDRLADRPA